jgi:hypothetical protein
VASIATHSTLEVVGTSFQGMLAKTGKNFKSDQKSGKKIDLPRSQAVRGLTIVQSKFST